MLFLDNFVPLILLHDIQSRRLRRREEVRIDPTYRFASVSQFNVPMQMMQNYQETLSGELCPQSLQVIAGRDGAGDGHR